MEIEKGNMGFPKMIIFGLVLALTPTHFVNLFFFNMGNCIIQLIYEPICIALMDNWLK